MQTSEAETRQRLIEAAGEEFAAHGFRSTTVRGICARAKANVAAVNYHFGDKQELYRAVFNYARQYAAGDNDRVLPATGTPEERLHGFVRAVLGRIFDAGRPSWHGRLIAREMIEPTAVLDDLVNEQIRPRHERLKSIIHELAGAQVPDETVRAAAFSVVAQCLFYHHCRSVVQRLYPDWKFTSETIDRLAADITRFSLAGIQDLPL